MAKKKVCSAFWAGRPIPVGGYAFRKLVGQGGGYVQRGSKLVPVPNNTSRAADTTAADLGPAAGSALDGEDALRAQGWRLLHVDDDILVVEKVGASSRGQRCECALARLPVL
jgi:hypothetical protein